MSRKAIAGIVKVATITKCASKLRVTFFFCVITVHNMYRLVLLYQVRLTSNMARPLGSSALYIFLYCVVICLKNYL